MAFRVETIFSSLREYQGEKVSLEQQLNEVRNKRRALETSAETCKNRANQAHETNQTMQETLKVALHKVAQMQIQAKSLEDANEKGRDKLNDLNFKIEDNLKLRTENIHKFEQELENLAEMFKSASENFTDNAITEEMENAEINRSNAQVAAGQSQKEVENLMRILEGLSVNDTDERVEPDIPGNMQNLVLEMFSEEKQAVDSATPHVQEDLDNLKLKLEELSQVLPNKEIAMDMLDENGQQLIAAES